MHTDLCGPITPNTWDGNKYFLTFLDDFTHYAMVYLIKRKEEVSEKIKEYIRRIEAHWNTRIDKLRSDNGREYVNKNAITWCKFKGIEMNTTVPYTPQLNGKTERLNRTLMEKTRALFMTRS